MICFFFQAIFSQFSSILFELTEKEEKKSDFFLLL
nr:MAG TPA: hypothetical protein [Caudoviricetes sp.]